MDAFLQNKDFLVVVVQLIYVVVPVVISWFIRSYVKNSTYEKQIGSIMRLSNVAIDYVENLEKRGALQVPEGASKGTAKLRLAAEWLESELKKNGISVNNEEAAKWISSEFQNRVGGVVTSSCTAELTSTAVDLVQGLEKGDLSAVALNPERINLLTGLATDWLLTQLANQRGVKIPRDEAEARVRAEILNRLQVKQLPSGDTLMGLAHQALGFLNGLKQSGRLTMRPGTSSENIYQDIAVAWMLTEAAKLGIPISPNEIAQVITVAFRERAGAPSS